MPKKRVVSGKKAPAKKRTTKIPATRKKAKPLEVWKK